MIQETYRHVRDWIASGAYDRLQGADIKKPAHFNWVRDVFEGIHVAETPAARALVWTNGTETRNHTFAQLAKETNMLLNFLRSHDVQEQDVVFFQLALLPVNWLVMLAGIKGGLRLVPAATILGVQDIVYRFGRLMPKVVVTDMDNAPKIDEAEVLSGRQVPLKIIVDGSREGWVSVEKIYEQPATAEAADTRPDDPLFLFFTSGTTGMPKVVMHTHFSYPLGHLTTASWIGIRPGDLHYNISQPGWAKFAWSSFFAPWSVGAGIFAFHHAGRFNARNTLGMMEQFQVSTFCAPPTVLRLLIQEDLAAFRLSIRECVAAGEPLNPEIIEAWKRGTGLTIRDGYGQTESSCMVANMPGRIPRFGSMGFPTFLYEIVIADDEGNELPVHEEGNITVRTGTGKPNGIFLDYLDDAKRRNEVFKHGLYYTGDKAYRDADGYIWFVGRDDDVIKSSDYRVGPFEVESVLLEHDAVVESAVVGSPHPVKGYEIKAFIITAAGYTSDRELADELFAYSRKNLAPYKMPRIIEFVTELPKTISGKIRRVELRAAEAQRRAKNETVANEYFYTR